MEPTVPPSTIHRVRSFDDHCHTVRSNSMVLSGQDDGSPLCTSRSLLIDGSRPVIDASFGSCGVDTTVSASGGSTTKSATSPASNSRVDLLGDQTPMGLPSPMMKFRCASGPEDYPLTRAYEERLLPARRRERTPPPTATVLQSQSFSHSTENEIMGEIIPDNEDPALLLYSQLGHFPVSYTDEEQSSFVDTTTGASFGKMTAATATTHPTKSDANRLLSQRSFQRDGGLFDSQGDLSSSAPRDIMVALDVLSLAPTIRQAQPQIPTPSMSVLTQAIPSLSSSGAVPIPPHPPTFHDGGDVSPPLVSLAIEGQAPITNQTATSGDSSSMYIRTQLGVM